MPISAGVGHDILDGLIDLTNPAGRKALLHGGREGLAYGLWSAGSALKRGKGIGAASRSLFAATGGGIANGWKAAWGGWGYMTLPMAMLATGQAPTGHKVSTFASQAMPWMGFAVGQALSGNVGGMIGGVVGDMAIKSAVGKGLQAFMEFGHRSAQLETGGDYQDTEVAFTMRQRAAQEMSRSLLNARQYLGREAVLLHQ